MRQLDSPGPAGHAQGRLHWRSGMSADTTTQEGGIDHYRIRLYRSLAVMALGAISVSAAVIYAFQYLASREQFAATFNQVELMVMTLIPYMISAVIAALTAMGMMTMFADFRQVAPTEKIIERLRDATKGNLATRLKPAGEPHLREIASEVNMCLGYIGSNVSALKLANRQQWGVLCRIRLAVESQDYDEAIRQVALMEQNWDKIADLEQQLIT